MCLEPRPKRAAQLLLRPIDNPEIPCVKFSKLKLFEWTSGTLHPVYTNCKLLQSSPIARCNMGLILMDLLYEESLQGVFGFAAVADGAISPTTTLADLMTKPMITGHQKAKGHGGRDFIDGIVVPGRKYAIYDDIYSTGGSGVFVAEKVREAGGVVTHAIGISDYGFGARERFQKIGVELVTATNFDAIRQEAIRLGDIDEGMNRLLDEWHRDPFTWAIRRGVSSVSSIMERG